jgi:hypothetical protein
MASKTRKAQKRLALGNHTLPTVQQLRDMAQASGKGFTAMQLAEWGVPWPPKEGWLEDLIERCAEQGRFR